MTMIPRKAARAQTVQLFAETQTAPAIGGLVLSLPLPLGCDLKKPFVS